MKSTLPAWALLLTAVSLPLAALAQSPAAEKPLTKTERKTLRVISGPEDKGPKEMVTFLGVETAPVEPALGAQLGLAEETGLVVRTVVADSPANGVLQVHDVLLKLDDQILIDVRQLAVLIRGKKAGDEVTLHLLRTGQSKSVKVKLIQREMPKRVFNPHGAGPGFEWFGHAAPVPGPERVRELMGAIEDARGGSPRVHVFQRHLDGGHARDVTIVNTANSKVVFTDDAGTLELSIKDGKKSLVAKGSSGDVLFEGPVDTPEQRAKMPEDLRNRLDKVETMEGFDFKSDGDAKGVRMRVIHGSPDRVSLPLPGPSPQIRALSLPRVAPAI